ncbi:hypothetical protein [Yoonia sp. BS5-3]|uniref:Uncharacterized protein n=1 Tax=Yoonia phaeophyticola TaxID=3137369 RepID=A0ABZ2V8A1_9RHOB
MSHQSAYDVYALFAGSAVTGIIGVFTARRFYLSGLPGWVATPFAGVLALICVIASGLLLGFAAHWPQFFGHFGALTWHNMMGAIEAGLNMSSAGVLTICVTLCLLAGRRIWRAFHVARG